MNSERYPHVVLHGYVDDTMQQGRPRKRWLDNTREDCDVLCFSLPVAERLANDRLVWRSAVHNLGCQRVATMSSSSGH